MSPILDVNLLIEWLFSQNINLTDNSENIRLAVEIQCIGEPFKLTVLHWLFNSLIAKLDSVLLFFKTGNIDHNPTHDEVYLIQPYVIVCRWLAAGQWFSLGPLVSPQ